MRESKEILGKPFVDVAPDPIGGTKKRQSDFYDIIGRIIDMGIKILGIPIYAASRILESFVRHDGTGIKILGGTLFIGGVILSADGFFQAFGGQPLFPFFENSWIGNGWFLVWSKINFWAAITCSLAVSWIESHALRGKKPAKAKQDYDAIKNHQVPEKNPNSIDLVEARRRDYKRAGMGERSIFGIFVLMTVLLDILQAFSARNPWGQLPTIFAGILLYNICSMIAAEIGFVLWCKATDRS